MGYLTGLEEYLDKYYTNSIFDQALDSKHLWEFHLHGHRIARARVLENLTYDLKVAIEGQGEEVLPKIQVKLLYPADLGNSARPLIKIDEKTEGLGMVAILSPHPQVFYQKQVTFPSYEGETGRLFHPA